MKKQSGITLMSLGVYVVVMLIVIAVMSTVVNKFYNNTDSITADTKDLIEFNKFNTYFLKEIKAKDNKVDEIKDNYILFSSGNSFSLLNEKIYYNDIRICEGVIGLTFTLGRDGDGQNDTIICVNINFDNFNKMINYKVEEIY